MYIRPFTQVIQSLNKLLHHFLKSVNLILMKTSYIVGIVVVILALFGWMFFSRNKSQPQPQLQTANPTQQPQASDSAMMQGDKMATGGSMMQGTKEITIEGSPFKFVPAEIKIKKGDKVKVIFKNTAGTHDFVLSDFNVKTKVLSAGGSETVEFSADKAGTFEYYCSVGNHRAMGMKGNLIVE